MKIHIIDDTAQEEDTEVSRAFFRHIQDISEGLQSKARVAFDCEGVNLSRVGTLEIVSLCFESGDDEILKWPFLVDLGNEGGRASAWRDKRVEALKVLMESEHVIKIIHDSRMDADALFHLHNIRLVNMHDTSCYHAIVSGKSDVNLNDMLLYNGIRTNTVRDSSVYKRDYKFWSRRPLTAKMIEWAGSDVDKLLQVATIQLEELEQRGDAYVEKAAKKSKEYATQVVEMKVKRNMLCRVHVGSFIGPRGSNIRSLQNRSGTLVYRDHGPGLSERWLAFYPNDAALRQVERAMGN